MHMPYSGHVTCNPILACYLLSAGCFHANRLKWCKRSLQVSTSGQELVALNPRKKIAFPLTEKISLSPNTRLFRFGLQSPQHKLGLPIGQHMFFYAKVRSCYALLSAWSTYAGCWARRLNPGCSLTHL